MPKSKVTDSSVMRMRNAKDSVNWIQKIRKSVWVNILVFVIPLGSSYLAMILMTPSGFAGYLALSKEQKFPMDMHCLLIAVVCFFLCHGVLLFQLFAAKRHQDRARVDVRCQDEDTDTTNELETVNMRIYKYYCNLVFEHLEEYYKLDRAMANLGLVILLVGITMSFLKLLNPVWLPFVLAVVLDFMILIHRLYYSNSRKAVEEEENIVTTFLHAQAVMQMAEKMPEGDERNKLYNAAVEAMLDCCPTVKDARNTKNEESKKEDLPGLRLIFQKKSE